MFSINNNTKLVHWLIGTLSKNQPQKSYYTHKITCNTFNSSIHNKIQQWISLHSHTTINYHSWHQCYYYNRIVLCSNSNINSCGRSETWKCVSQGDTFHKGLFAWKMTSFVHEFTSYLSCIYYIISLHYDRDNIIIERVKSVLPYRNTDTRLGD